MNKEGSLLETCRRGPSRFGPKGNTVGDLGVLVPRVQVGRQVTKLFIHNSRRMDRSEKTRDLDMFTCSVPVFFNDRRILNVESPSSFYYLFILYPIQSTTLHVRLWGPPNLHNVIIQLTSLPPSYSGENKNRRTQVKILRSLILSDLCILRKLCINNLVITYLYLVVKHL